MRQFFVTNDNGEKTPFRFGLFYDDSLANLRTAVVFVLMGLTATKDLFALNLEPGLVS
jgi:hypothetical protein